MDGWVLLWALLAALASGFTFGFLLGGGFKAAALIHAENERFRGQP